jgi:prevent-host-death family protein
VKTVTVTEFKAHCLRLLEEARRTGESIEVTKRGKRLATVTPAGAEEIDWSPGKFRDAVRIVGDIEVDGRDLGIDWEAMR